MTDLDLRPFFAKERCFWCEGPMFERAKIEIHPDLLARFQYRLKTRDHLVPVKSGGKGYTVAACWLCNHQKGSLDPMVFRDKMRPHVPIEKVVEALLEAKKASAQIPQAKKGVTRHGRMLRYFLSRRQNRRRHPTNP